MAFNMVRNYSFAHFPHVGPLAGAFAACGICATVFNVALNVELPSLTYYNIVHSAAFLTTEFAIWSVIYAYKQLNKFKVAWLMTFSKSTMNDLYQAAAGSIGSGNWIMFVLTVLQGVSLLLTFFAEWSPTTTIIGAYSCTTAEYTVESLAGYTVSPSYVSGDIDFAMIYMYGLPLADGMAAGLSSWPNSAPLNDYDITDYGPVLVLETVCDPDINNWSGTPNVSNGNGFLITSQVQHTRSFNIGLNVYLPSVAFDSPIFTTTWGVQYCNINGYLGNGKWTFNFQVDPWKMVTAGKATSLVIQNHLINVETAEDHYSNDIISFIREQETAGVEELDFTNSSSNGQVLMTNIMAAFNDTIQNNWYKSTTNGDFSNMMSWATMPDGLYYPNLTSRGLAAALGAVTHQIFLQYSGSGQNTCIYSGMAGSGKMAFVADLVIALNIIFGLVLALLSFQTIGVFLLHPIRKSEVQVFRQGAALVERELSRAIFSAEWFSKIPIEKRYDTAITNEMHVDKLIQPVRYGENTKSLGQDTPIYCIGPANKTISLKTRIVQRMKDEKDKKKGADVIHEGEEEEESDGIVEEIVAQLPNMVRRASFDSRALGVPRSVAHSVDFSIASDVDKPTIKLPRE